MKNPRIYIIHKYLYSIGFLVLTQLWNYDNIHNMQSISHTARDIEIGPYQNKVYTFEVRVQSVLDFGFVAFATRLFHPRTYCEITVRYEHVTNKFRNQNHVIWIKMKTITKHEVVSTVRHKDGSITNQFTTRYEIVAELLNIDTI